MACPKHRDALPEESGNTISHEVPSVRGPNLNVREAEKSRPGTSGQTVGLASKGSGGNWLGIQRGKPYEPPPGLVAFFQNSHSPFPLRRAPRTQHRRLGFSSYAASVRAQPSVLMEKQGVQSNQQGGRAPVPNSGRAADRGNFQYEGPNQFRQGQAGAQHQHRGRSWARPGYGRGGFRGSFRGRGDFRQNHEGGGASAAKSNAANCGLAPAQTEIATAFDQSAKAETLDQSAKAEAILQKALAAIQELKKEPMPSNGVVQNAGGDAKASSNQQWQVSGEMSKHVKEAAQEEDTHIKQRCPVYNAPKVYALPVGYGVNKGGFFHVPTNKKLAKMGDAKVAIIQVSDGEISAANVVCELERLLPNFAPWKVDQVDTKTFRTLFPSASELSRMVEWGPVRAKSQKATLEFRPASSGGRVKATLVDVWVQFNGLPSEFCTVPHIWGVGSTLGVASEVDMAFYRKHGICRVQVGVIDPQAIPFAGDVEIAKVIYEVHFWVEDGSSEGLPLAVDEEGSLDDDQNNNDKEHKGSDGKEGDGINKAANAKVANVNKQGGGGSLGHKHNLDGTKQVQVQCAHDITTAAGTSLIADAGDGPMLGDDHMSPIAVTRKELTVEGGLEDEADGCKPAIPEAEQTSVAGRKRRTSTTDEHSLARAERLKAERNGEGIGISLGKENEEIIRSVQSMKNFEKTIADQSKNGNNVEGLVFDLEEDESDEELDKIILYNLCGGIFWNCDGFGDPKKHRFVADLTKEYNLSFIALSETVKKDFSDSFLRNLCAGRDYLWHCKEPRGRSGGILLGIDLSVFDIGAIDEGDFYVRFLLLNKNDGFKWSLVCVYGPAQDNLKEMFLAELVNMASKVTEPILIGGDFNILRSSTEKNNDNFNPRWPFLFNAVIDGLCLRELALSGRQYTWANARANPTYEKLDRVLVSTDWELHFPRASVLAHSRDVSDHTPLILNTGDDTPAYSPPSFKMELGWFLRHSACNVPSDIRSPILVDSMTGTCASTTTSPSTDLASSKSQRLAFTPTTIANNYQEYVKLKAQVEVLQHSQRNKNVKVYIIQETFNRYLKLRLQILNDATIDHSCNLTQVLLGELCDLEKGGILFLGLLAELSLKDILGSQIDVEIVQTKCLDSISASDNDDKELNVIDDDASNLVSRNNLQDQGCYLIGSEPVNSGYKRDLDLLWTWMVDAHTESQVGAKFPMTMAYSKEELYYNPKGSTIVMGREEEDKDSGRD
ncbi:hypothetical protein Zm00014a_037299 [Zea mays]|uniref:Endonuclease/exonuclease/phosphatase domain-containing protein n=1 Tax=Zea mays TaxID=4577 RepID=A0A3L6EV54_MAIZE|nr:hypothetical protein Zm00014a_037299 [Zea mays]